MARFPLHFERGLTFLIFSTYLGVYRRGSGQNDAHHNELAWWVEEKLGPNGDRGLGRQHGIDGGAASGGAGVLYQKHSNRLREFGFDPDKRCYVKSILEHHLQPGSSMCQAIGECLGRYRNPEATYAANPSTTCRTSEPQGLSLDSIGLLRVANVNGSHPGVPGNWQA